MAPVPPFAIGREPVTLLVRSIDPASMLLVTFSAPIIVALPILVTSPIKLALVVTVEASEAVAALPLMDPLMGLLKVFAPEKVWEPVVITPPLFASAGARLSIP